MFPFFTSVKLTPNIIAVCLIKLKQIYLNTLNLISPLHDNCIRGDRNLKNKVYFGWLDFLIETLIEDRMR